LVGCTASTPRVRIGALSGRYNTGLPGSVSVPKPAGSPCTNTQCAMPMSTAEGSSASASATGGNSLSCSDISSSAALAPKLDCTKRLLIDAILLRH
jgi:hypothetical protein